MLALAFLVGISLALRTQAIHARFWIDEGLSVGISSHPLLDIPGVLREDGSPPLYYLILKLWMSVFGSGEADTHALSVAFAMLTVPAAWLGARALFGDRAAWIAAVLAAINPFLTYYAQETRMYTLVALLSTVGDGDLRRRLRAGPARAGCPSSRSRSRCSPTPTTGGCSSAWGRWRRSSRSGGPAPTGARCCATPPWPTGSPRCSTCRGSRSCSPRPRTPARRGPSARPARTSSTA